MTVITPLSVSVPLLEGLKISQKALRPEGVGTGHLARRAGD